MAIGGATNQTYSPVAEDVGHELRVTETASNAGGSGSTAESEATAVVMPPVPVDSTLPTVTGTAQQGETLTEHHGEWTQLSRPDTPTSGCGVTRSGAGCVAIGGATGETYSLVGEDVGHTLRVAETASNAGGPGSPGRIGSDRGGRASGAGRLDSADDHRYRPAGPTLTEHHGEWTNSPTELHLPVDALRR